MSKSNRNQIQRKPLKISVAFEQYRIAKKQKTLTGKILEIFECLSLYLQNSMKIDRNFDLLGTLGKYAFQRNEIEAVEDYELRVQFRKFFNTYAMYTNHQKISHIIYQGILRNISKLKPQRQVKIIQFFCGLASFKLSLSSMSVHEDGSKYHSESIFSPIVSKDGKSYTDNALTIKAYAPLVNEDNIAHIKPVYDYLMNIIRANKPYTFYRPENYSDRLTTFEILGTVLVLIQRLISNNLSHFFVDEKVTIIKEEFTKDFWDIVQILYITLHKITLSTQAELNYNTTMLERTRPGPNKDALIKNVSFGQRSIDRLNVIFKELDTDFVDRLIFSNSSHLVDSFNMKLVQDKTTSTVFGVSVIELISVLFSLIHQMEIKSKTPKAHSLCVLTEKILKCSKIPDELKSRYLRKVLTHNLVQDYHLVDIERRGCVDEKRLPTLKTYLCTVARRLGEIRMIHSADILDHFGTALYKDFAKDAMCLQIIRLFIGYTNEARGLFENMCRMISQVPMDKKMNVINDITTMAGFGIEILKMLPILGNEGLSHFESVLIYLNYIGNILQRINTVGQPEEDIDIVRTFEKKFKAQCLPILKAQLLSYDQKSLYRKSDQQDLDVDTNDSGEIWNDVYKIYYQEESDTPSDSVFRLVLTQTSINILNQTFGLNINDLQIEYVVIPSEFPDYVTDAITQEMIINPVLLPIREFDSQSRINTPEKVFEYSVLLDQSSLRNILWKGINPFTRQSITMDIIVEFNTIPSVISVMNRCMNYLRCL